MVKKNLKIKPLPSANAIIGIAPIKVPPVTKNGSLKPPT